MDLTFLLKNCKLFADLERNELATIREMSVRKELRKGQLIFGEGDESRGFYLVVAGAVKIYRLGADGRERVLHVVEAGETFAEATVFMDEYPATAEAVVPTTVIRIDRTRFKRLLSRDQKLTSKIFVAMAIWLRELRDALTDLTMKEVPARFASYVLSLPAERGQPLRVRISKTTVAQMIGTTKETFSRILHRLAEHEVLTYRGQQIKILDRRRLERIAAGTEKI